MEKVVVGVSITSGSPRALIAAAEEAKWRGAELVAVQAWHPSRAPAAPGSHLPSLTVDAAMASKTAQLRLRRQVADALGDEIAVRCRLVQGQESSVLVSASDAAVLLVIGASRTKAKARSAILTHSLIARLNCPIMVLPEE